VTRPFSTLRDLSNVRFRVGFSTVSTRRPDNLSSGQQLCLKRVTARCPEPADLRRHIASFPAMMKSLDGHHLPRWIKAVENNDLPPCAASPATSPRTSRL
jgi:hypothetical protein